MTPPDAQSPSKPPRLALVTGASRGLGAALAERLGGAGWHVVAVARTTGALEELDDRIRAAGGTATLAPMDVTDDAAMQHLCRGIHDRWGGAGLWIHAAIHAAPLTPADQIAARDWEKSWAINVEATRRLIGYVAPLLRGHPNAAALFFDDPRAGQKFFGSYGSTKAAQMALARSWAAETARHGPAIHIACPPPMPTATRARFFPGEDRGALTPCAKAASALLPDPGAPHLFAS